MASDIYLLNIRSDERRRDLLEAANEYRNFSEAVPRFEIAKGRKTIVLVSFEDNTITHIAYGVKGNYVATKLLNLKLTNIERLENSVRFDDIVTTLRPNVRPSVFRALEKGTKLPEKTRDYAIKVVEEKNPSVKKYSQDFSTNRKRFFDGLEETAQENFSFQRDSICMALELVGMPRSLSTQWVDPEDEGSNFGSILELFPEGEISDSGFSEDESVEKRPVAGEDLKIISDWSRVPGFDESMVEQAHVAARVFYSSTKPSQKLTVIMANRETLESQTGADLIYRNDTTKNFVMVQYKNTNSRYNGEEVFRWSDTDKLTEQVGRMDKILKILKKNPVAANSENYRFTENPFFLKICKQTEVKPDNTGMMKGMYLPLEYWKRACDDGRFCGPMGGNLISYSNAGRYITNSDFIRYVSGGWIGTPVDQFHYLDDIVTYLIDAKRTVTYAFLEEDVDVQIP